MRLVGTSVEPVSAGNHLCDAYYQVPIAWEQEYVSAMQEVCSVEAVQLVLPTTDHETVQLARARTVLPAVSVSRADTCATFLDKHLTALRMQESGIVFARSCLPGEYEGQFPETVVKPRDGRGSRGVRINPESPSFFSDDYVVQERYRGREITTAFYVDLKGDLHGSITFERELAHGTTVACSVTREFDKPVLKIIELMLQSFVVRGSCNFQSIVTTSGEVVPFEVNCRISGTNSIRHHLGFRDVEYAVDELLFSRRPSPPTVVNGSATRLLMDVIYPGCGRNDPRDRYTDHIVF
jgi:carbamoyl-phosphate synthase large subunit